MADLSRREFAALAAAAAAAPFAGVTALSAAAITAREVIDRIKKHIGVEWKLDSVDGVKAGDPSTTAKGIVTTSLATMAVLQQAVKAGANLVITAHPTFYARADVPAPPAGTPDPVSTAKNEFITRNNLVVFRLSDHWRQTRPDPNSRGHRGCAPLVQVPVCGRFPTFRNTSAYAGRAGEPCQKPAAVARRNPCDRRSTNDDAAYRVTARHDADSGGAENVAERGCHRRRGSP